ncbi:protein Red [Halyomorpha halys]|uniref:protein Red n=1 Tax=Halyomorpha halys TaxID=286706 RepID=UPI0006D4D7CD|nr:protein Red-like [Halyomorpha halys]
MDSTPKRQSNLTNKDFRELINSHVPIKREQPEEIIREVKKIKKQTKAKSKKYQKKTKDESLELLLSRYRDRARERREGKNPDYLCGSDDLTEPIAYHAVGPDAKHNIRLAERRRQLIQESKYLGGDMAHTHLVKGLDLALLNKVRSEIEAKTKDIPVETVVEEDTGFKGQMTKNIHDILFKSTVAVKNPLFAPGKMCYLVDLTEEEQMDTDVPTTVIRSQVLTTEASNTIIIPDAIIDKIREALQDAKEDYKYKKVKKIEPPPEHHQRKQENKKREFRNAEKVQVSKTKVVLKKLVSEPTGYDECYPGAEAMMEAANDSDFEDTPTLLESWPKAAFQFGLKKAAGRRTRQSEKSHEAHLDWEWARIRDRLQL